MIPKTNRIESIDLLRGLVMVIMALDHVRDYFYYGSFFNDPTNLETTTPILFFTRFITHFCAPVFVFLAGTSAYLYGSKKTEPALFKFLLTRGIWLIFLELAINNLIWTFDLTYSFPVVQVIWAIGFSMVCLSFLILLPKKAILAIGITLIAGHNLLDGIVMQGQSFQAVIWYLLHQQNMLVFGPNSAFLIQYPLIPWIGVMALGYCFGAFYQKDFDPTLRKKWLLRLGFGALALFLVLRGSNLYGDLVPWSVQDSWAKSVISFFNVTKYPPSLLYLCITLGPALLFLQAIENIKNKYTDFFLVFGRVPLFYYFLHVFVIHVLAIAGMLVFGGDLQAMILTAKSFMGQDLVTYGYSLFVVYLMWIGVILLLYPICKKYMVYKANNKDKWWLSYL
ncbi:heparan-alpha-glucosaminide N-acetyltransferase domain-containing protein [Flavobacteriaceae bacterium F89]|uniref:Heparan-alpha-glucosaminide N-acetyltransferase domain-containing protein n=1 Tax=Cerina litoralis TaxID=2874477 RepID=A0AAE3ET65_9FLAO|nr:heparan-alpha-glucosaminide N-acetyltransferase domain-containing protein [Cerina litoralis]MCG2459251.1 heparan-alpha-glucosaminide N-acetyltransferase domain-containing protein [Cerina litoralis]